MARGDAAAPAERPAACGCSDDGSANGAVRWAEAALAASPAHALPPRPDCIFLVGRAPSLCGFPPWLTAAAELYHLGALREAARGRGVAAGAARFARTQQRLGK